MQLDSEQTICSLEDGDYEVTVEVRGEVNVTYKGENYRRPSEFPDELKERIANNPNVWDITAPSGEGVDDGSNLYVGSNNWFELFIWDKDHNCLSYDCVDVEGYTYYQLKALCVEALKDYLKDNNLLKPVTMSWKVYGADGHRQGESFLPSVKYDWSDERLGTRILEVENSDKTGTNDYTIVRITRDTELECEEELEGQITDGLFEECAVGKVEKIGKE